MNIPLKVKVKFWFNFLKLAHQSQDKGVTEALKKSADFYKSWDNYLNSPYDKWWREHSHLFRDRRTMKRMDMNEKSDLNDFCIRVPFFYSPTVAAKVFKKLYSEELTKVLALKNRSGKVKKIYGGSYFLTSEEFQASNFEYYLIFTQKIYLPNETQSKKLSGTEYCRLAIKEFSKLKKKNKNINTKRQIPFSSDSIDLNSIRNARRYAGYSKNLLLNVASGEFPGKFN